MASAKDLEFDDFNPHAIPPMGSRGDSFDAKLVLGDARRSPIAQKSIAAKERKPAPSRADLLEFPPHPILRHAQQAVLLGVLVWYIPRDIRLSLLVGGAFACLVAFVLMQTVQPLYKGQNRSLILALLAIVFLWTPVREPIDHRLDEAMRWVIVKLTPKEKE
jgi:hypothetical protein